MGLFDNIVWACDELPPHCEMMDSTIPPVFQTKSFEYPCLNEYRINKNKELEFLHKQQCFNFNPEVKEIVKEWEHSWTPTKFYGVIDCVPENFNSDKMYLLTFDKGKLTKVNTYTRHSKYLTYALEVSYRPINKMVLDDFAWQVLPLKRTYSSEKAEKLMTRLCKKMPYCQFTYSIKEHFIE